MSGISSAFNFASAGLTMNAHWSEVVSGNIASADDPDYAKRSLSRMTLGDGVAMATGVTRSIDSSLTRMYHDELSRMTRQEALSTGLTAYTTGLGEIDDANSPMQLLTEFQTSLDFLFNDPGQTSLQSAALQSAQALTRGLNRVSGNLDTAVAETQQRLNADIADANRLLEDIAKQNKQLSQADPGTALYATLQDQQAATVSKLAEYADIKVDTDKNGLANVAAGNGMLLVERDKVFTLEYDVSTGQLTAGGYNVGPDSSFGISEGSIAGNVELLQDVLPQIRLQLDEFARALIQTFESADASLTPPAAGLFTDAGQAYDSASLEGLAGRIAVNDAVVPEAGGSLWRLRDGIGAATAGSSGDSSQLGAFIDALDGTQSFDGGTGLPSGLSLAEYGAAMIASQQDMRSQADKAFENHAASAASIDDARLNAQGVNIDDELQQLLQVEKSYSANAQVISTLSEMLDVLLAAVGR